MVSYYVANTQKSKGAKPEVGKLVRKTWQQSEK